MGEDGGHLFKCSNCRIGRYCSKECQKADWKGDNGHKYTCKLLKLCEGDPDQLVQTHLQEWGETFINPKREAIKTLWTEIPDDDEVKPFPELLSKAWDVLPLEERKDIVKKARNTVASSMMNAEIIGLDSIWLPKLVPEVYKESIITNVDSLTALFVAAKDTQENDSSFVAQTLLTGILKTGDLEPLNRLRTRDSPELINRARPFLESFRSRWFLEFLFNLMMHCLAIISRRKLRERIAEHAIKMAQEQGAKTLAEQLQNRPKLPVPSNTLDEAKDDEEPQTAAPRDVDVVDVKEDDAAPQEDTSEKPTTSPARDPPS